MTATIAEAFEKANRERDHDDVPHPWWGDPPNREVALEWRRIITVQIEGIQNDLSAIKGGVPIVDHTGHVLRHAEVEARRVELVKKRTRLVRRLDIIKNWLSDHPAPRQDKSTKYIGEAHHKDKDVRVSDMFAAARRFRLLEDLYEAVDAYDLSDTDDAWMRIWDCLEIVRQHGSSEHPDQEDNHQDQE